MSHLIIYISFCFLVAFFGKKKRFGFWGYLIASLIFTPIGGILMMIPSEPKIKAKVEAEADAS
ncbi:MAG: hypothetical protein P9L94_00405 [Candidatus Hinthialibacter antarcticus]|nr:hypothetical protein [Candidatus Hinthialibacter antarcticus]